MKKLLLLTSFLGISVLAADVVTQEHIQKAQKDDWAYNLPESVTIPKSNLLEKNPVDSFIQEKLSLSGLEASPEAEKKVLVRRLYQTLTGLEPTYDEIQKFVESKDPLAYEQLVDKLLASPRYGEKWGRHWLDVARYADGKGYTLAGQSGLIPHAWSYRDYVIRSFNEDKPYNEFVMQQLAADLTPLKDKRDLAALGFIRLGQHYRDRRERQHEMVDVTTQAFMGLTVSCARCHDHKFDPIPTADYYSLFGVFKSINEPNDSELPVLYESPDIEARKDFDKLMKSHEAEMLEYKKYAGKKITESIAKNFYSYFGATEHKITKVNPANGSIRLIAGKLRNYLRSKEALKSPLFKLWHQVLVTPAKTKEFTEAAKISDKTHPELRKALSHLESPDRSAVLNCYLELAKSLQKKPKLLLTFLESFKKEFTKNLIAEKNLLRFVNDGFGDLKRKYLAISGKITKAYSHAGAPAKAMIVRDNTKPYNPYVFIKGQRENRGEDVPRRFLQVLSKDDGVFKKGSGRLELAERLVDPMNPLTARVMVNRIWSWNFGKGLVRTPNNFGSLGGNPSHPELLDYLSLWFMENSWSVKKLQRMIVNSKTFKQSSQYRPEAAKVDGENLLLWRKDPMRKSWEQLRDSVIQSSGALEHRLGGAPVKILTTDETNVRSVYALLNRRNLEGPLKYFDFPSTAVSCESRTNTISPQQGLFLMNSEFSARYAQKIADQAEGETDEVKVKWMYKTILGRLPSDDELKSVNKFIIEARELYKDMFMGWEYGYAKFDGRKIDNFEPFKVFKNNRWQFSEKFPDPVAGYAFLSARGGHPGKNKSKTVVRRCNIYAAGTINIAGKIIHKNKKDGDGIKLLILHNGKKIGEWLSKGNVIETDCGEIQVQSGDKIDFVVDSRKSQGGDIFEWPMEMSMTMGEKVDSWSVFDIFSNEQKDGIVYSVWSCLAQTLTMSNEFLYVD